MFKIENNAVMVKKMDGGKHRNPIVRLRAGMMKNIRVVAKYLTVLGLLSIVLSGCAYSEKFCSDTEERARALIRQYGQCRQGDSCFIIDMYDYAGSDNCLSAFQCSVALREGSDLEAFRKEARSIVRDYRYCPMCSRASCIPLSDDEVFCNEEKGKCEIRLKTVL